MEKVIPYKTLEEAVNSLDNGGRFYNIFTKAHDGVISEAELGKVGKIFGDKRQMILFLELSLLALPEAEKELVLGKLDSSLKKSYEKYQPTIMEGIAALPKVSSSVILKGVPKLIKSHTDFNGMIMIPMLAGNVTTFTMVPMIEEYDLYEMHDADTGETLLMAHIKGSEALAEEEVIVGGVIKQVQQDSEEGEDRIFLEISYLYSPES